MQGCEGGRNGSVMLACIGVCCNMRSKYWQRGEQQKNNNSQEAWRSSSSGKRCSSGIAGAGLAQKHLNPQALWGKGACPNPARLVGEARVGRPAAFHTFPWLNWMWQCSAKWRASTWKAGPARTGVVSANVSSRKAAMRSPARCCPSECKAGISGSPCSPPSAWSARCATPFASCQTYSDGSE